MEYAVVISSQTVVPAIIAFVQTQVIKSFTVGDVLLAIWGLGTILNLGVSLYCFMQELWQVKKYRPVEDRRIQQLAEEYLGDKAVVVVSPDVDVPKVMGIRKAYIYMPLLDLSNEEIKLILLHEFQHIKGRDIFIKMFYLCLKAIFWWNPVVDFFQREVENLLELRCDWAIVNKLTEAERVVYLEAILNVFKQSAVRGIKHSAHTISSVALVGVKAQSLTQQRFEIIADKSEACSKRKFWISICVVIIAFFCSYFVILQPVYEPPADEIDGCIDVTKENSYIVIEKSGEIKLYVDGEVYCTLQKEELDDPPNNELNIIDKGEK